MMERMWLGVLYLSGWFIFSTCLHRQYHFVPDPKNWKEAQTYCRDTYTDLATIGNTEEMKQFRNTVRSTAADYSRAVWIGLYSTINWMWSDGYKGNGSEFRNWETNNGQPNLRAGDQFCVTFKLFSWNVYNCSNKHSFICYKGFLQYPKFAYVSESMNWSNAQKYCRKNFIDLATITSDNMNREAYDTMPHPQPTSWIGLFRNPDIYWSDGSDYSFRYWEDVDNPLGSASKICGVAALQRSGQWRAKPCETKLPFVCYSIPPPAPVKRQIVKLRMKLDSSVDPNDPAVKADILKQLQDKLKEKGVSGVTLKWREQPDGKVFHKDRKGSQESKNNCEL